MARKKDPVLICCKACGRKPLWGKNDSLDGTWSIECDGDNHSIYLTGFKSRADAKLAWNALWI